MARFKDKTKLKVATLSTRRKGESPKRRHRRRQREALSNEQMHRLNDWCETVGAEYRINNDGKHFIVNPDGWPLGSDRGPIHFAQWWPSTAKLVVANRWTEGIHCHDAQQLIDYLATRMDDAESMSFIDASINYANNNVKQPKRKKRP